MQRDHLEGVGKLMQGIACMDGVDQRTRVLVAQQAILNHFNRASRQTCLIGPLAESGQHRS